MELVLVALITGAAAVTPQALTWWQNRVRDRWERQRLDAAAEAERARAERERRHVEGEVIAECCQTIEEYMKAVMHRSGQSWTAERLQDALAAVTKLRFCIDASAEVRMAAYEALSAIGRDPIGSTDQLRHLVRLRAQLLGFEDS